VNDSTFLAVRRLACRWALIVGALLAGQAIGSGFALTEDDFFAPMPRVLSGARLVQPLSDAPVAMTVIDRALIEASSATSIAELLRLVPGFQVTYAEGIEALSTYHGFADSVPRRMQVLVDGRSVYSPGINGVVWAALPLTLEQIERIEVVRGPNAAAYGSNAFLGTVNIITRTPEASERLMARAVTGSRGVFEAELAHAGRSGAFSYRINASSTESEGFVDKADDSASKTFNLQGVYRPTLSDSLTFGAGLRETDFDSESFRVPRERLYRTHYQQLVWNRILTGDQDLNVQLYHNALRSPDDVTFIEPGSGLPVNVDYSLVTDRYDLELQHRWSPSDNWRVSWGGGLRRDIASGPGIFDTADRLERDIARLFANVEWRIHPDAVINAGLMGEDFSDLGRYASPRLALNWHAAEHHTLRASVARAYRVPTFFEQRGELKVDFLPIPGSPDLIEIVGTEDNPAEEIRSIELGYLFDAPAIDGTFDLRLFHHEVTPLLHDVLDDGLPFRPLRYMAAGALRTTGVEIQADFRPSDEQRVHLAYAYAKADGGHLIRIDADGKPKALSGGNPRPNEPSVPEHTLTAMLVQELANDWRLSGTFHHVSKMEWLGEGDLVEAYSRVDAKLSKRFRHESGDIELSLNVQNLFDDPYWEFTTPDPSVGVNGNLSERSIYAQLKFVLR
jgi:iron complex outermembrane receptor protein